MTKALVYS